MHATSRTTYIANFLNTEGLLLKTGIKHVKTNLLLFCGKKKEILLFIITRKQKNSAGTWKILRTIMGNAHKHMTSQRS